MKIQLTNLSMFCLCISLLASCEDIEIPQKEYPYIIMDHVETMEEGAMFQARVINLGKKDILSYGFVWNVADDTEFENWFKKNLITPISVGTFSTTINTDLLQDVVYFVRPFIETVENTVFGPSIEFTSSGSKSPEVLDYSPKEGFDGTLVKLKGRYFSLRSQSMSVFVENIQADITRSTEDSLIFTIPASGFLGSAQFKIVVGDKEVIIMEAFEVLGPEINSISKTEGHSGDIITIQGQYLTQYGEPQVYFNEFKAEIVEIDADIITAVVPVTNISFGDYVTNIRIVSGLKSYIFYTPFIIKKSWNSKTSTPFKWPWEYTAFSYNNKGYILEYNTSILYEYDPIADNWEAGSKFPGTNSENGLYIIKNDKLLKMGGRRLGPVNSFWEYDFLSDLWIQKNDMPFSFDYATHVNSNELEYIITNTGQVWTYNHASQEFIRKNDIAAQINRFLFAFKEDNGIYLITYGSDWLYDINSDTWAEINKNMFQKDVWSRHAIGFYSNGNAYVLENGKKLFKYYANIGLWVHCGNYPGCRGDNSYKTVFVIGNDAYIAATTSNYSMCAPLLFVYRD